jgi:subtilisin family serine protease
MKRMMKQTLKNFLTAFVIFALCAALVQTQLARAQVTEANNKNQWATGAKFRRADLPVPNRYIVVFNDDLAELNSLSAGAAQNEKIDSMVAELASLHGGHPEHVYKSAIKGFAIAMSERAAKALSRDPRVAYVEEDCYVFAAETQSNVTWGLDRIDQRNLTYRPPLGPPPNTYMYDATGKGVNAYVLDTGINISHQEFGGRALIAQDFVGDGQNGNDCNGHGTHVSGTLGGTLYGVAKNAKIYAVRVLDCAGSGSASKIVAGLDWVTAHHIKPAVVNMSLSGPITSTVDAAVRGCIAAGVTVVVAAGNSARDASLTSPARVAEAITVGSTDKFDHKAFDSNYGAVLDVFAPGEQITSAWIGSPTATNTSSGTSMASPHVAGVAALYLQNHPDAAPAEVAQAITSNASRDKIADPGAGSPNRLLYSIFSLDEFAVTDWDRDGRPDLVAIQKGSPSINNTIANVLSGASNFGSFINNTATALGRADMTWAFDMVDWDGDGRPDLVGIVKSNTGSGMTEVHILSSASGFQQFIGHYATGLGPVGNTVAFDMADWDGDGRPDLVVIIKSNTGSGMTEVHILSGASGFQQFIAHAATGLYMTDSTFAFNMADWDADGKPDLVAIKKSNTGSGMTEVHILSGASGFQQFIAHAATCLQMTDSTFAFDVADWNADGKPDLVAIKKSNTASGMVEADILSGASGFQVFIDHAVTGLQQTY